MMMFAAALAAAAPAATVAPQQPSDAHAQHKAGTADKSAHGMDCCKDCCKDMAKKHEGRDQKSGHSGHSGS